MSMVFDHIGIFVRDLEFGRDNLKLLLGSDVEFTPVFEDKLLKVRVQFAAWHSLMCYELVAPFGPNNPVDGILESGRAVLNHVAYQVDNLDLSIKKLVEGGALLIAAPQPAVAFGGRRVAFLMLPLRIIVELIEAL